MDSDKRLRLIKWGYVLIWIGCIYSTLYAVRPICEWLKTAVPFSILIDLFLALILLILIYTLMAKIRIKKPETYFLFLTAMILYVYSFSQIHYPEEKIHFAEYGLLSYLIFNALRIDFSIIQSFIGAFFLTSGFGWGDEGIQYLLPNRYYELKDVLLNSWSGTLGLFLVYIYQRELKT